ncbi:MAG: hypothetical protein HQL15_04180 [Candidatus Omnitrophica bacterium]|nr:hypothetical protein [Candidatus Omnitrophota bacterium]
MMTLSFRERLKSLFLNDYFIAFLVLVAYLCTNNYIYAWDDQHLEIPLLKHLIDPSLYRGDYYVESLAKNFSSYLFPILAKFIKVSQIPTVYFILFLFARYMMFFFVFKLCQFISKDKFAALCAVLMFFLTGRTEEFLYRTFSHQELAEGFMFAGIYLFYKERFFLAALIFGLAANIHAIYNLFPMCYMLVFLLLFHPKRWSRTITAGLIFTVSCLPFLLWQIPRSLHDKIAVAPIPVADWMPIYLRSCPQNLLFSDTPWNEAIKNIPFLINQLEPYVFVLLLYIFLVIVSPVFRKDKKAHVIVWVGMLFIIFSTVFTYVIPSRFILDLNLLRNEQYIRWLLMAYTAMWAVRVAREAKPWQVILAAVMFLFIGFNNWIYFVPKLHKNIWVMAAMAVVAVVLWRNFWPKFEGIFRKSLIFIPLLGAFIAFCIFHYNYLQVRDHGEGFWQLQRNWVDMQMYVRDHTPKDAFILTPINTDMGGFRIHSERRVVVCGRDCGIVGFDYPATLEWSRRMEDLKDFVVMTNSSVDKAIFTAIFKYKVDYIVFMNYYAPKEDNPILKKMYQNGVFSLFKVTVNAKN